jgi:hypothetical protein
MNPRPVANLRESLEKRLTAYAVAASAAGVGLLAWPQPALARIIYTKTHTILPVQLDLNHDGITDYLLNFSNGSYGDFAASVMGEPGNLVAGYGRLSSRGWASALAPKGRVGPNQRFGSYRFMFFGYCSRAEPCDGEGPWFNAQNRYLGFQFLIKGQIHYGWARLSVSVSRTTYVVLTGYAYETVPGKPLVTGKTKGPDVITLEPGTLGQLARGASAIQK